MWDAPIDREANLETLFAGYVATVAPPGYSFQDELIARYPQATGNPRRNWKACAPRRVARLGGARVHPPTPERASRYSEKLRLMVNDQAPSIGLETCTRPSPSATPVV